VGTVLDEWIAAVQKELGLSVEVDVPVLLDLARVAAHSVERTAAPLTTFLVGYVMAARGGDPAVLLGAARRIEALADAWAARSSGSEGGPGGSPE